MSFQYIKLKMSKVISRSLIKRAVTLRAAGYTLSAIVEETGISTSTLYRYFKELDIERGKWNAESINDAQERLLNDSTFIDSIKLMIASAIEDDLAFARQIREAMALTLEEIIHDRKVSSPVKARSLAALSTSLKLTQDVQRKALNIDNTNQSLQLEELPTLTIVKMTDAEEQAIRGRKKEKELDAL